MQIMATLPLMASIDVAPLTPPSAPLSPMGEGLGGEGLCAYILKSSKVLQTKSRRPRRARSELHGSPMLQGRKVSNNDGHRATDERMPGKIDSRARQDQNHRAQPGNKTSGRITLIRSPEEKA